jgi:hypothetical protein
MLISLLLVFSCQAFAMSRGESEGALGESAETAAVAPLPAKSPSSSVSSAIPQASSIMALKAKSMPHLFGTAAHATMTGFSRSATLPPFVSASPDNHVSSFAPSEMHVVMEGPRNTKAGPVPLLGSGAENTIANIAIENVSTTKQPTPEIDAVSADYHGDMNSMVSKSATASKALLTPKATLDFNGDGKSDILWQHTDGDLVNF